MTHSRDELATGVSDVHPELNAEQRYIDKAYEALDRMRDAAARLRDSVLGSSAGGTHQARYERDVIVETSLRRLARLDIGTEPLCFGRIDRPDETWYIGRIGVSSANRETLVVDWRAPVSEAFYRATGRHPMGLVRRRHFLAEGRRLVDISDEGFGDEANPDLGMGGPGALLAALERVRTGQMRDIVSTIQREQDEIIRADLPGILVVQGGPGTGKTAVALHRAAYLLFTHRSHLERSVLVIGPNQVFLRYIDRVLPALGESGVALSTPAGLVGVLVRGTDPPEARRIKGDVRMAKVVERAVADRQRPLVRDAVLQFDPHELRMSVQASASIVAGARRRRGTHNERRRHVETAALRRLYSDYVAAERARVSPEGGEGEPLTRRELTRELKRDPEFWLMLDRMWPVLGPDELVHDLFAMPPLLASAARDVLTVQEQRALHRPASERLADVEWTAADVPLIDAADAVLGPRRPRSPEEIEDDDEHVTTYRHIVADEAQDLSPMQLRMLARRSVNGSMTLVGDVGQATSPWAPSGWDDVLAHLPRPRPPRVMELTVNYRTPRAVMDLAGRVLRVAVPELPPPESFRDTGEQPSFHRAGAGRLGEEVTRLVLETGGRGDTGAVAVICPASLVGPVEGALAQAGVGFGDAEREGLQSKVTVLAVELAKGLEFDEVIVVEPARIVRETAHGQRALYVALTRTTRRLSVVHAEPLPAELERDG